MPHTPNPHPTWPKALPLIAILRGIRPQEAVAHAQALIGAGFDCIEVPTNSPDWPASVQAIQALAGDSVLVGAGTVMTTQDLDLLVQTGGRLAVSPHTEPALIADARNRGLVVLPGAMTMTEVLHAWRAGAHAVKIFPAATLGPGHVRALRAVLPAALKLVAVGGITPDNLADYVRAGCTGAGLGGELFRPGQSPADTAERAGRFVQAWRTIGA